MHATKLDLRVLIAALYTVVNSSKGVSSVVLARRIGVRQKAAWKIGHAIREMMRDAPFLPGIDETDVSYVGGSPKYKTGVKNPRGKGTKKAPVLLAVSGVVRCAQTLLAASACRFSSTRREQDLPDSRSDDGW